MTNVRRLQTIMARIRSMAQLSKVRRLHSESIVATSGGHHVYKPRTIYRRYLDGSENIWHEYYKRNLISSSTCILTKSKVPLKEEIVRQAFSLLCRRQTLLRARVIEAADGVSNYYESVSGLGAHKINFHVVDRSVDERLAVWEELLCSMDYERDDGCLWKAVLLREKFDQHEQCYHNALITNISHSVVDGASMVSLCQQIIHFIEILAQGNDVKLSDVKELPLFPSSTGLLAHKLQEFEKRAHIFEQDSAIPPSFPSGFPKIASRDLSPYPAAKAMLRNIPWSDLKKLLKSCRRHQSTLTGLLTAIAHIAFSSLLDPASLPADATNDMIMFVNTSRYNLIALPEGYPLNAVASLQYRLLASEKEVWTLASAFTKQLHTDVANSRHFATILDANHSDARKIVEDSLNEGALPLEQRKQSYHAFSSPLPIFTQSDPTKIFSIAEVFGGSPVHGRASTFRNFLITLDGNMTYITVYDGSFISAEVAQAYYDCVTQQLNNILDTDNHT